MGLFSFLSKKRPVLYLRVGDVKQWLDEYQESIGMDVQFSAFKRKMQQLIKETEEGLDRLQGAKLLNENIPGKARLIMDAHRTQYKRRIGAFLEKIELPRDRSELGSFAEAFSEKVAALVEATQKDLFVLKEFFEKEAADVARSIGAMDRAISGLRSGFEKLGMAAIDHAYTRLREYEELLEKRVRLDVALAQERSLRQEPEKKLAKIENRIAELKSSNGFRFVMKVDDELEELAAEENLVKSTIRQAFSPLSRPLKKLQYQCKEPVLDKYLADPVEALVKDKEAAILKVLRKLDKQLAKLDLKAQQQDRTRDAIAKVTKEWLVEQAGKLVQVEGKRSELKGRLAKDTTRMLITEQENWKKAEEAHLEDIDKRIALIQDELERLSPKLSLQRVRDALRALHKELELEP